MQTEVKSEQKRKSFFSFIFDDPSVASYSRNDISVFALKMQGEDRSERSECYGFVKAFFTKNYVFYLSMCWIKTKDNRMNVYFCV